MKSRRLQWTAPLDAAAELRTWFADGSEPIDLAPIEQAVAERGDAALIELTSKYDAPDVSHLQLAVAEDEARAALDSLDPEVREALETAIANVRLVAEAQLSESHTVELPQGQRVTVGKVPLEAAGIYAPGGRASYPSSVVMGCVPARVAGVSRLVLVTPPGPDGKVDPTTLAAAHLCGVDEIFAVGGAQAIFALARGTESIRPVNVIAGPGNAWVQAAKRAVFGDVTIDSPAGPSDLTVVFDRDTDLRLAALDLCAQAEHGPESPLVAVAVNGGDLDALAAEVDRVAALQPSVNDCRLALIAAPSAAEAIDLINEIAPEHLQLMDVGSVAMASKVTTAGCVFTGPASATAFGDYIAGSNHILPTDGTGKSFGPVSTDTFRRSTARVSLSQASASALAQPLDALARAEGLPVHGLSAMARRENGQISDS
ncbi:MAG: histidinol dehydrogenase [Solirubrobacterales bacterium]